MPPEVVSEIASLGGWLLRQLIGRGMQASSRSRAQTFDAEWQPMPDVPALPPPPWAAPGVAVEPEGYQPMPQAPVMLRAQAPADPPAQAPAPAPVQGPAATPATAADSYSAEMDDPAVACINCTRRHLWEMRSAAADALAAVQAGAVDEARRQVLRVAGEALVLERYDWTQEKFSRARPRDLQAIGAVVPAVQGIAQTLPTGPKTLVLAWSSLDEAMRFARSANPTPRDQAEIADRLDGAGAAISHCESEEVRDLPSDQQALVEDMLPVLREVRHQFVQHLHGRAQMTKTQLADAEQALHTAALALQPTPTAEQLQRLVADTTAAEKAFKQALFQPAKGVA